MKMITSEMLDKIDEIARLHDEAFWHLHQYDGHAKSSDGSISIEIGFRTVWTRKEQEKTQPSIGVAIYSYVVASDTPSYPSFGQRNHWFETVDEALTVMKEWHAKAMEYNPSPEELAEIDLFAAELWDSIKDRVTVIEVDPEKD
jgi:hypothetical protein